MSVEQQYIDIFKDHIDDINNHSAGALNRYRCVAFEKFEETGFPTNKNEEYLYTDIAKAYETDYGVNVSGVEFPVEPYNIFRCGVPGINTNLFFVVNDIFYKSQKAKPAVLPDGVIACGLKDAAVKYGDIVDKYYAQLTNDSKDGNVNFNTAFAMDGFFLYVPEGVKIEQPIQLVNMMRSDVDMMANSRNLIIIGDGAEAKVLVCSHALDNKQFLANRVTEVFVGKHAKYEHYKLESSRQTMTNIETLIVREDEESDVLINDITLQNGLTRNNVRVDFKGKGAKLNLCGMAICDGEQHVDTDTVVNHWVGECETKELYKYVLNGKSVGSFSGRIMVAPDAQKTKAVQTNKNICLGHDARMHAKPHLEIYADDVICNHGATVGQLDDDAIFYLRSRGIPESVAKMLLMFAFVDDVENEINVPALKDTIKMMIERRFRGEADSACSGCSSKQACNN